MFAKPFQYFFKGAIAKQLVWALVQFTRRQNVHMFTPTSVNGIVERRFIFKYLSKTRLERNLKYPVHVWGTKVAVDKQRRFSG